MKGLDWAVQWHLATCIERPLQTLRGVAIKAEWLCRLVLAGVPTGSPHFLAIPPVAPPPPPSPLPGACRKWCRAQKEVKERTKGKESLWVLEAPVRKMILQTHTAARTS